MSITAQELKFNEEVYNKITNAEIDEVNEVSFDVESIRDLAAVLNQVARYMEEDDQAVYDYDDTDFLINKVVFDRKLDKVFLDYTDRGNR